MRPVSNNAFSDVLINYADCLWDTTVPDGLTEPATLVSLLNIGYFLDPKRNKPDKFENFISKLYAAGVHEIKVIEDPSFEQDLNEEIDIEREDTLTILERYVDDMEHSDKDALKNILKSLYVEALELV